MNTEPLNILIVEDDIVDRKLLERLLSESSLPVSRVKSADRLVTALELLDKDRFDIVLLDLGLPDADGAESFTSLQAQAPQVPVIVLSGLDDEEMAIRAVQEGVQDYLIKGKVDSILLARAIRYAIERKKTEHELQSAEQRYRTIFENSAVAITMADAQERLVSWNKFTEKLLNMDRSDLHLKPVKSLYLEDEWEKMRGHNVREKGVQHHLETKMLKKGGQVIDVDVSLSVLKDSEGNVTGSIGVIRDITDRKQAEDALRQREHFLEDMYDAIQDGIGVLDQDYNVVRVNNTMEKMHPGKVPLVGKKCYDAYHDRDSICPWCPSKLAIETGQTQTTTVPYVRPDESDGWVDLSAFPLKDENGQVTGIIEYAKDVTESRQLSEILDRKQKNLEAIFDAAPIGMLLVNEDMIVKRANDAVRQMVRKKFSQIINQLPGGALGCSNSTYNDMGCGYSPNCAACLLRKTIKVALDLQDSVKGVEVQFTLEVNGEKISPWLSISAEPVIIDSDKHAVVAINDVTDRKRAEEQLKETMAIKSQFISTVSHELRTPMASMKEAVLIVLDGVAGKINDDQRHFLDVAKRNIDRLSRLINDVLDFQKLGAGKMEFHMQENDVSRVVEDAYGTMAPYAKKKKVDLTVELEDNLPKATFDSDRIIQAITNLISNAIKFTSEKGQVSVCVRRQDEEFMMRVKDTGMGMPKEALPKIFDQFYRVHRPGKEIKGTGLGLSIVSKIVMAHDGRIEVESELNKGTTFTVFLPFVPKSTPEVLPAKVDEALENTLVENQTNI